MNLAIRSRRSCATQRKHTFAGLLLLFSMLVSSGAMADLNDRSADAFDESTAHKDQTRSPIRISSALSGLRRFRSIRRSLLPNGSCGFTGSRNYLRISGTPALGKNRQEQRDMENNIDVSTGRSTRPELALSLNELQAEERDDIIALRSAEQELSDAVAIARKPP